MKECQNDGNKTRRNKAIKNLLVGQFCLSFLFFCSALLCLFVRLFVPLFGTVLFYFFLALFAAVVVVVAVVVCLEVGRFYYGDVPILLCVELPPSPPRPCATVHSGNIYLSIISQYHLSVGFFNGFYHWSYCVVGQWAKNFNSP